MIAKHIPINSVRKSSYEGLVNYIFDPQNKTERIGLVRSVNCYSDLPDCVIAQVLNTQQMNKRATSDKTYHLVVSFRDDELPDEVLQKVEDELCDGLGFGEHQRISVVHHDTDHLHVHIAINKIHPARFTIHNPHYDYKVIGELCEKLEQKYGLTPDNHETKKRGAQGRASNIEFKAGHDSLIGWIRQECLEPLQSVTSWTELHQVLSDHGLELQARGNGFVFVSGNGVGVKASSVDRSLSKSNLVKKLGVYKKINSNDNHSDNDNDNNNNNNNTGTRNKDARQYQQKPLHGNHDTTKLYSQYVKEQNDAAVNGRNQWHTLRDQKDRAIASARDQAKLKRLLIKSVTAGRLSKKLMHASVNQALKARIESIKKDYKAAYQASKTAHRRMDWLSWLVKESRRGNQEALAVLRSRKGYQSTENNISGTQTTEDSVKNDDVIETITKTGTVIISRGSTVIRDSGDRLFSVAGAAQEKILAVLQEAIKKFGHQLTVNGSDAYREKVVQVAVSANLDVTFDDEALERRRQALIQQENTQKPASGIDGGLASKDNALQKKVFNKCGHSTRKGRSR
ncbi:MAG: relaxase/mobilization nuclease domain-containing protein [Nitrosomonas sp.]|nr:relaxase/mobilization nuclease domain-containing protein [Nitrosomonas sp.]